MGWSGKRKGGTCHSQVDEVICGLILCLIMHIEASQPDLAIFLLGVTSDPVIRIQPTPPEHGPRVCCVGRCQVWQKHQGFDLPLQGKGTRARVTPGCSLGVLVTSQHFGCSQGLPA